MIYWGFYPSCVRRMPLNRQTLSTKNEENGWTSAGKYLYNFTSECLSVPENVPKHPQKLSRIVAHLRRLTANLSWLLPFSRSKVSISDKRPPDLLVNVTATNDALQSICLTLCLSDFTEAAKAPPTIFHPLLSNYFLLSACPLLSGYFLAVSCYKLPLLPFRYQQ